MTIYNAQQKHDSILLHTYVLNEFLTADRSCSETNILKQKLIAHIFTLLLAPFASKLVHYSSHSETLNFRKNRRHFPSKRPTVPRKIYNFDVKGAKRSVKM